MQVFQKRGKWCIRTDHKVLKFDTEAEALAYAGEPEEVLENDYAPEEIETESSEEEADTYEQEIVFFGKSYGKKKI